MASLDWRDINVKYKNNHEIVAFTYSLLARQTVWDGCDQVESSIVLVL